MSDYWESVVRINEWQTERFFQNILKQQFNTLAGKTVAVLGFAFKADTGDTRDSPAIPLCQKLLEEKARVRIHDPKALENAREDLRGMQGDVEFVEDAYQACKGAHSIALVTQWQEYRELDFQRIHDEMVKPAFMFDGRNHLDPQSLHQIGFNVFPLGKKPLLHL